ncbi:MAG TPA: hypothetical protein VNZ57_07970 [Longimicrobiales bacterium]|nr:hypothetical protein [Longimicrobiales bacterium]
MLRKQIPMAVLFLALGCGVTEPGRGGAESEVIPEQLFVQVYVELQDAQDRATSAEAFEEMKSEIFARHGVTEEDILRFVTVRGRDIQGMIDLFEEIRDRYSLPDTASG